MEIFEFAITVELPSTPHAIIMDYLLSGNGCHDNLSLEDMIECDIKTEFEEHFSNEDTFKPVSICNDFGISSDFDHEALLHSVDCVVGGGDGTFGSVVSLDSKADTTAWLQITNIPALSKDPLHGDTTDGEVLMVNPQTGLPVQVKQIELSSCSRDATTIAPTRVQFVNANLPTSVQTIQTNTEAPAATDKPEITVVQPIHNAQLITQALTARTNVTPVTFPQTTTNTATLVTQQLINCNNQKKAKPEPTKVYPKPVYSYSCLIAMALKNSETGALPVSEIYNFMTENFPYFHTAPDGWKNSVRHNLSLNKCFEKIENPKATGNTRKGCLWGLNPGKIEKMDEEIAKWRKKDLEAIHRSMAKPDVLEILEKGKIGSQSPHHPNNILSAQQQSHQSSTQHHNTIVHNMSSATNGLLSSPSKPIAPNTNTTKADVQLSMIEIKPADTSVQLHGAPVNIKLEPIVIKPDMLDPSGAVGGPLMSEDNFIETSLSLDPSIVGDLSLQNGLWDELGADGGISLDDIMISSLGQGLSTSPLTIQPTKTGLSSASATSPLVSLLTSSAGANAKGAASSHTVTPSGGLTISRTIFAQM